MGNSMIKKEILTPVLDETDRITIRVVIISDTHNDHRSIKHVPDGDILIHCGDFTTHGNIEHAIDFNDWLGSLSHRFKFVINGNHENNAAWKGKTKDLLSNAIFLKYESYTLSISESKKLKIYGTDFSWPIQGENPYLNNMDNDTDIIITHGPPQGFVDGSKGCPSLSRKCKELSQTGSLKLVTCGHIHYAYGEICDNNIYNNCRYVNASLCGNSRSIVNEPIVVDLEI